MMINTSKHAVVTHCAGTKNEHTHLLELQLPKIHAKIITTRELDEETKQAMCQVYVNVILAQLDANVRLAKMIYDDHTAGVASGMPHYAEGRSAWHALHAEAADAVSLVDVSRVDDEDDYLSADEFAIEVDFI